MHSLGIPVIPSNDPTRCQIPWMRPQENFFQYNPSSKRCENFPYTGACRNTNQNNGYKNVFASYDECAAASPNLMPGYETGQQPDFTITQLEGRIPIDPSTDYGYGSNIPEYPANQGQEYQPQDYVIEQIQDYSVDYDNPNMITGQFEEPNKDDFGKYLGRIQYKLFYRFLYIHTLRELF